LAQGSAPLPVGVSPGDILAGKYRIDHVLGVGGMGVVVAAHHLHLDARVAIKLLLPESAANADTVARFAREGRAAVRIRSEHVARVLDTGTLDGGARFMVMEFLDGVDLAAWLDQHGAPAVDRAVELLLQACEAIAEAHSLGIVHRDLKPANLFCVKRADGSESIKVLDFGISKVTGPAGVDFGVTKTTTVLGSPLYMSPEQMQSTRDVDARTDIWSLGVILFELLTLKVPFPGATLPELILKVATAAAPRLRDLRPDAPAGLEAVLETCLKKRREDRFESIGDLAEALAPYAPERSRISVERISSIARASAPAGRGAQASSPQASVPVAGVASVETVAVAPTAVGAVTASDAARTLASSPAPPEAAAKSSAPAKPGRGRRRGAVAGALGVGALALIAWMGLVSRSPATRPPAASLAGPGPTVPLAEGPPPPVPSVTASGASLAPERAPTRAAPSAEVAPPSSPAPTLTQLTQRPRRPKATASGAAPPLVPAASTPNGTSSAARAKNCDPNFYLDANGDKHFKPECF
jgi:eukaryotic-like serine/threonine-protein kinase